MFLQSFSERLQLLWGRLQGAVNVVMDSSQEKKKTAPNGIKQVQCIHVYMYMYIPSCKTRSSDLGVGGASVISTELSYHSYRPTAWY